MTPAAMIPNGTTVRSISTGQIMRVDGPLLLDGGWNGRYCCCWPGEPEADGSVYYRRNHFAHDDLVILNSLTQESPQ